jgi:hypothetical protein
VPALPSGVQKQVVGLAVAKEGMGITLGVIVRQGPPTETIRSLLGKVQGMRLPRLLVIQRLVPREGLRSALVKVKDMNSPVGVILVLSANS